MNGLLPEIWHNRNAKNNYTLYHCSTIHKVKISPEAHISPFQPVPTLGAPSSSACFSKYRGPRLRPKANPVYVYQHICCYIAHRCNATHDSSSADHILEDGGTSAGTGWNGLKIYMCASCEMYTLCIDSLNNGIM